MTIPPGTVEKRVDFQQYRRETALIIGPVAFTLTTTYIANESCILVLSEVFPNHSTFRTTE